MLTIRPGDLVKLNQLYRTFKGFIIPDGALVTILWHTDDKTGLFYEHQTFEVATWWIIDKVEILSDT